ncbi:MAG TPA: protein kinase [Terriglobales bacterium]|nr:protein kinase [Terriglobales bacterium]
MNIGQTVSHYRIEGKLGSGGMGVVYQAADTRLQRKVALKFLPEGIAGDGQVLERFLREARAASSLNHPNICTIYAIEEFEGEHFIAMELLEGRTLDAVIAGGPLSLEQTLTIAAQITEALEAAHARGIVHRDIKPSNIYITTRGQAKVLDFGLAKMGERGAGYAEDTAATAQPLTSPGSAMGTAAYMSPEQARGQATDARTDLFSLGAVIYQLVTGRMPFRGDTSAVLFDAILNREPVAVTDLNPVLPGELQRIISKALEKERELRYQTASDIKSDLLRLKRDLSSDRHPAAGKSERPAESAAGEKSIAVLYFENLSGIKDDEYFRDGMTEDIITELSKIRELKIFPRPTVLPFRDRPVTSTQIGQQLHAAYVLGGSVRRSGSRLRVTAQLVDTRTDFPLWSERFDREVKDVFDVQDEIARSIAGALRIALSPQEQSALAKKPTENAQAYDLYLRGRSYMRQYTRQDLQFALQMFESAVALDRSFALAHAGIACACARIYDCYERELAWMERCSAASGRAIALQPNLAEALVAQAWVFYADKNYKEAIRCAQQAIEQKPHCDGVYHILGSAYFASDRWQEALECIPQALEANGDDYNTYVPFTNAVMALRLTEETARLVKAQVEVLEKQLKAVPEDMRARNLIANRYAFLGRFEDSDREMKMSIALRPNDPSVLYNAACNYAMMGNKADALSMLVKAKEAGYRDANWARRDPDLESLRGEPEFEKLYPAEQG